MQFFEIIKSSILHSIQSLKFVETYIGEVVEEQPIKIKIDDKIFITEDEIIRTSKFPDLIERGTKLLIISETGGQKFFLIDTILEI